MALGLFLATGFVGAEEVTAAYWAGPGNPPVTALPAGVERAVRAVGESVRPERIGQLIQAHLADRSTERIPVGKIGEAIEFRFGVPARHFDAIGRAFEDAFRAVEFRALEIEEKEELIALFFSRMIFGCRGGFFGEAFRK